MGVLSRNQYTSARVSGAAAKMILPRRLHVWRKRMAPVARVFFVIAITAQLLAFIGSADIAEAAVPIEDINPDVSDLDASDPNGSAGGRVNGLSSDASDDQVFYAASEWGGLRKTIDGGLTWTFLDKHLPMATWDVEVDPGNTGNVYATSFYDGRLASVAGINVSRDGGATWTHPVSSIPPMSFNCADGFRRSEPSAFGIGIRADLPSNVAIGTNCGLAISTDSGANWVFRDPPSPAGSSSAADIVWDVVWQGTGGVGSGIIDVCGNDGHFRSINGGSTWAPLSTGLPSGRCSIAASPDESTVLFVAASDNLLYESDNATTWTNLGSPDTRPQGRIPFVAVNDRAGAAFDLWFGDVQLYRGSCTSMVVGQRCPSPPTGGGGGWSGDLSKPAGAHNDAGDIVFDTEPAPGADRCPRIFSSDGGLYRNTDTTDPGCQSPSWEQANVGLHAHWLFSMSGADQPNADDEDLYYGLQDSGSWATRKAGKVPFDPSDWSNKDCCDVFDFNADPNRVLLTVCCGGPRANRLYLRAPGAGGSGEINTYPPGGLLPGFRQPDIIDRYGDKQYVLLTRDCTNPANNGLDDDGDTVIDEADENNGCPVVAPSTTGSDGGVFITDDVTASPIVWSELGDASEPPSNQVCGVQVAVPSATPNNPTFYVESGQCSGRSGDALWKYTGTATGGTWDQIDDNDGMTGGIGIYGVDPNDPNRIYVSNLDPAGPQMMFSTDGGANWQNDPELDTLMVGGATPDFKYQTQVGPTNFTGFGGYPQPTMVAYDPENPDLLVAGSVDAGVFFSTDAGQNWGVLTDPVTSDVTGIPHLPRAWFAYFDHEVGTKVFIGTQGRGVWRLTIPTADVALTKTDSPDPAIAGDKLTYTITVDNTIGPDQAENVKVVDTLPEEATFVASSMPCVEDPTDTLTCDLGDIPFSTSKSVDIQVMLDADAVADEPDGSKGITNTAVVSTSGSVDPDLTNNSATEGTIVNDSADLRVTKVSEPDKEVPAGQPFTWTINIDNLGKSHSRDVRLEDTITGPPGFVILALNDDQTDGSCTQTPSGPTSFTCEFDLLEVDARAVVSVTVTSAEGGDFNDEAVVSAATPDPDTGNNRAVDSISVTSLAGLQITEKIDDPDPVLAGNQLTYHVDIRNNGPSTAVNVLIEDFLPAEVSIISVSSTPPADQCNAGVPGDPLRPTTCKFGTLIATGTARMTIVVRVHPDTLGLIHNDAEVTSETFDPDNSDNLATEATTVNADADLVITKSDTPDPVQAGRILTYELRVENAGPSTAVGVRMEDVLPREVDFQKVTISNGPGTCVVEDVPPPAPDLEPGEKVTCDLGTVQPNLPEPVFISIEVLVKSETPNGPISNRADVVSSTTDSDNSDNSDTEPTQVIGVANLSIVKTSDKDHYRPSETIKYTIMVTNLGPSDALNVIVTDYLPTTKQALYQFDTAACDTSQVKANPPILTCSLGTIVKNGSKSFNIHLIVRGRKDEVVNRADVVSDNPDPVMSNNTSTRTVLIKNI